MLGGPGGQVLADGPRRPQGLVNVADTPLMMNFAVPNAPVVSAAVTMTWDASAVVGAPEIRPVEELIDSPVGSPVAV